MFLRLWARYNMSFPIRHDDRELLRVEVLDVESNGETKFRLWYYKWRETRPDRPYVDVEIKPHPRKDGVRFIGYVYANEAKGILREHLAEIADLLKRKGIEGVSLIAHGRALQFSGAFRDSVLGKLGIKPEFPPGEPPAVQHLGGFRFRVGDREVEFARGYVKGGYEFYAEPKFSTKEEAERFARSLKAIGVDARIAGPDAVGYTVRLDSDSFFGLLAATDAVPPGLALLYHSEEGDFRVYASMEGVRMRFYFAVKHGGVWKVAEGLYNEKSGGVMIYRAERDILEAIRGAVEKALKKLDPDWQSRPADVEEPREDRDEEGRVKAYYLYLYGPHLAPFLEHAAETVKAQPAEVRLEGRRIIISAGGVRTEVEFKLLKLHKAEHLTAADVVQTLALYKSLKEAGVRVEITPRGVKVDGEAMWALVAVAGERGAPSKLPAEVMPGVELLKVYNASGVHMYIFKVSEEGTHYYFVVKTGERWRAAGGKYRGDVVRLTGKAAHAIAEVINAVYSEISVNRRVEVKQMEDGTPYIALTNVDLRLLGLRQREP